MLELSGLKWCARYPTSARIEDLAEPFQSNATRFVAALRFAGAGVSFGATWRPAERAHLMHWAWAIARGLPANMCRPGDKPGVPVSPASVPALAGVAIDWTHGGDFTGARLAAAQMIAGYKMEVCAALASRHITRQAIDMTISWKGTIEVKDARGIVHRCQKQEDLWSIGASFGVLKLSSDPPHWSIDGH